MREFRAANGGPALASGTSTLPTPAQARENSLLEDALSGRPDYTAALRRAAEANISEESPVVRQTRAAREARIDAEVARLSDAVEKRRRERLASDAASAQASQTIAARAAARAACDAQASGVGAGTYTPYSPRAGILGSALAGAMTSSAAEEQARQGCYRAYGL
ncbi:hypothetical protein [Roseomonas indoligenes]|uniref:Uncharacterized protein n=1 Tax=Roseomonas indoligenes TaxID=2820811 RepID=A0A940MS41_9PROT|nr:hypothetical protein [Pararoseomonas indoligenes]MBP0493038.1 hypothetical protein [Pararoseomonas indoligenes]